MPFGSNNLNDLKHSVRYYWHQAANKIQNLTDETRYGLVVDQEEHEAARIMCEVFGGELLDFLKHSDLPSMLSIVAPSRYQLYLMNHLLEAVEAGELLLQSCSPGVFFPSGQPYFVNYYLADNIDEASNRYSLVIKKIPHVAIDFHVRWFTKKKRPFGFSVRGKIGNEYPRMIDFLVFPRQPETPKEVEELHAMGGIPFIKVGMVNRERIVIENEFIRNWIKYEITTQYCHIGSFEGEESGGTYWIYASQPSIMSARSVFPAWLSSQGDNTVP